MRSMRVDCEPVRIETWEELERYMQGSAGSVGRIMAPLLGAPASAARTSRGSALAFQLTNFIRDVREDWDLGPRLPPARGPRALRRQRGGHRRGASATDGSARWSRFEVARARELFAAAAPAIASVPAARAARACGWPARSTARARPRRGDRLRRAAAAATGLRALAASAGVAVRRAAERGVTPPRDRARRRAHARSTASARRRAGLRRELRRAWRSRASWPARAPTCWSSTATRSASARRRPARRRRRGCTRWASRARSARRSRA